MNVNSGNKVCGSRLARITRDNELLIGHHWHDGKGIRCRQRGWMDPQTPLPIVRAMVEADGYTTGDAHLAALRTQLEKMLTR